MRMNALATKDDITDLSNDIRKSFRNYTGGFFFWNN
jgi:hypothetical protein